MRNKVQSLLNDSYTRPIAHTLSVECKLSKGFADILDFSLSVIKQGASRGTSVRGTCPEGVSPGALVRPSFLSDLLFQSYIVSLIIFEIFEDIFHRSNGEY